MANNYDKSGVLGGNYDSCVLDFEAAHQALLKEVRNKAYAEGYGAGREYERNLPFANGQNPFKLGNRSEVENSVKSAVKLEKEANESLENKKKHKGMDEDSYNRLLQEHHKEMKDDEEQYRNLQEYYKENTAKSKQQAERDEIVEQAKADLARFAIGYCCVYGRNLRVEFLVDYKKRTVEAILRWDANGQPVTKGIARCALNDCFNVYIGQVIALLRALNVDVPDKYLNTPQPTEVRVGDVIGFPFDPMNDSRYTITHVDDELAYDENGYFRIDEVLFGDDEIDPYIIDDSRDEEAGHHAN